MKNTDRYVTAMILMAAIGVFGGFFFLHGLMSSHRLAVNEEINYNMPRPKSALYNFFFGLEGRHVVRKEIDPFKDKLAQTSAAGGSVRTTDPKKDAAAKATAMAVAAKVAAAKAAAYAARKKPEVSVRVVPKTASNSATTTGGNDRNRAPEAAVPYSPSNHMDAGPVADDKADRMSPSQWRSLVVGQPSQANVAKLIAAFNEKQVDAGTLYLIMNDLLQSSNSETQSEGLTIAQQVPSLHSFTVVSNNYEKLDGTVKKSADAYFMTYMQSSRLPILAVALQSTDNTVVHRAAQVMVAGLQTLKPGTVAESSTTRPGRGVSAINTVPTKTSYSSFIPLFQQLEKNSDSSISGLAQNALSQLQALSNT